MSSGVGSQQARSEQSEESALMQLYNSANVLEIQAGSSRHREVVEQYEWTINIIINRYFLSEERRKAPNYADICARYKTAYDEYFSGRFAEAQKQFEKLVQDFSDGPSKTLAARCVELIGHPY